MDSAGKSRFSGKVEGFLVKKGVGNEKKGCKIR